MDFVEGKTLESILQSADAPLDIDFVLRITRQLLDVLDYLHSQDPPIIFRDVKPANIMITPDERIKLIDFGVARIFSAMVRPISPLFPGGASGHTLHAIFSRIRSCAPHEVCGACACASRRGAGCGSP